MLRGGDEMDYMGDERFWDEKFRSRSDKPLSPERVVVENVKHFKDGTVLDVACGDGRNTLFLLEKGYGVKGIDFSTQALIRLEKFAERCKYEVSTDLVDLSRADAFKNIGIYDNILINHFRLTDKLMGQLREHLSDGGIILVSGFGHKHKPDTRIRKEDLIQPSDFEGLGEEFELIHYEECEDETGFFVTYIYRKRALS